MLYKNLCIGLLLVFTMVVNSQISSLELPKGEDKIKISTVTPIVSIYVDKNNHVYLEKEPIKICDIGKNLSYIRYKLPIEVQTRIKLFLYIDKNSDYNTLDDIRTQLASAHFSRLYYKTNSIEDKDVLKGISWTNQQSFHHFSMPEKVLTKKQMEKNERLNDSLNKIFGDIPLPPPPPPPASWFWESQHIIYSDSKDAIEEALESKTYSCVELTNDGYKMDNGIIKFKEKDKLKNLFYSVDIVFVTFNEDLKYSNYLNAIKNYKDFENTERGYFFELSKEIVEIHKLAEIELCN